MFILDQHIGERIKASFARQELLQFYGATIQHIDNGTMEIAVPPTDFLLRTSGIFHGGVIAALAFTITGSSYHQLPAPRRLRPYRLLKFFL